MFEDEQNQLSVEGETIAASAPDPGMSPKDCPGVEQTDPCTIVIVGATGDLTARKLVPALFNLYLNTGLPHPFQIVGCGRTELSEQQFRSKMEHALTINGNMDDSKWPAFADALHYRPVDYGDFASFSNLAEYLKQLDQQQNTQGNRIFYLALPPTLYKPVAQMLGQAGLAG